MMRDHVKLAAKQNLDGVIAIHWRTEEPRFNFRTFAHFASNKTDNKTVEQLYEEYLTEDMGNKAANYWLLCWHKWILNKYNGMFPHQNFMPSLLNGDYWMIKM